jgi:hypothetical protein
MRREVINSISRRKSVNESSIIRMSVRHFRGWFIGIVGILPKQSAQWLIRHQIVPLGMVFARAGMVASGWQIYIGGAESSQLEIRIFNSLR